MESPLQLIGAAEWAAAHDITVPVAGRLTAQMPETATELLARGARFAATDAYLGIPWRALMRHRHWLVGDGFSGQFRLAAALLRPRRVTFLDDGANAVPFADVLTGRRPYRRPGVTERGLTTRVAPLALDHVLGRAIAGHVEIFTAFDLGEGRRDALADRGIRVRRHRFDWTRASAPPSGLRGRVVLGSARPADGLMPLGDYVAWVEGVARGTSVVYLPHRRETDEQLAAVARIPGVDVRRTLLPAELVLAGAVDLDIVTLASSTVTTIPLVLAGTGSAVRPHGVAAPEGRTR
ncbi:hypothetical protein [Microbacterium album]|uniref:Uncharacterized protein n=1 Tax=Microbacterium album TaxID=2053191 RepID=A0A917IF36_9MICO|nr:hypothetical protein [Microbacterium album]GGH39261.1 hypothetical protein GCM10010921_10370 [Microbacterium album]